MTTSEPTTEIVEEITSQSTTRDIVVVLKMIVQYLESFTMDKMSRDVMSAAADRLESQEQTIAAMTARAERERQWISVADRLPEHPPDTIDEKGRLCFCTTNYVLVTNGKIVYPAYFEHQGKQPGYFWYRDSLNEITDITHWMPLPKPPKEDEHA